VFELLTDMESLDEDSFRAVLDTFDEKLHVMTAPSNLLPLDIIEPADVEKLLNTAASMFDYVIVDLPNTLVQWSDTVLQTSSVYFGLIELDMRSAQNALRLRRALEAESLPFEKIRFLLNRAPKFTDLQGKSRVKRLADSLDIAIDVQLPDGGKSVLQACDHGLPLASEASKNPLRKEIHKIAESLFEIGQSDSAAA
jgi:pilus assembly protein CpaE